MLYELIQQFERTASELLIAVRDEDEVQVNRLDSELQSVVRDIFDMQARSRSEISTQINFFNRLALRDSEDGSSVARYTDMMSSLFNRYLDSSTDQRVARVVARQPVLVDGYDPSLQELVLDSVLERIAVIGLDYRYIYCNKRNADFHDKRPIDFIGKHLLDMIDMERFQARAKPRLDQCFGGARVSYTYEAADARGRMFEVICRMTPFLDKNGKVAGAVLVLHMQPMFARAG
ncbi:PAS domain-containing protein [Hoeflea ulvae]|uniref:PAS domain-containing protein n=1 Tax=Hoeflea ulvae TaxID=2983764 RepID=A0ABT3YIZ0_9HYPH|nr:PAS domain-containing protein [Hoeflea ulvae]MCY0095870.1 PAS domain-containing protein [Hoeflea ulvae]